MLQSFEVQVAAIARKQAIEAAEYVAQDSPAAAAGFIQRFDEGLESLEKMPLRGAIVPETKRWRTEFRQILVVPYRLIYEVQGSTVRVLRVVHSSRRADPKPPK